ncbi:unnamed protein product [Cyclocybe aegerita]|uniref:Uncharacterized protein n=1 Tax=Cyclocybe aegerita TaxID=1973307 RepID=A0A8S0X1Q0_CYCAE|nr:unnamed protein product [Cyclocybe aegerita]
MAFSGDPNDKWPLGLHGETLIWDIVNNLCNDYRLLTKHRVALPVVAYFASRISLLVFAVGRASVETDTCRKLVLIFWSVFAVCLWFTSLLFYLAMDGMTCFVPTMLDAVDIGPTKHYFELIVQDLPQVSSLIAYLINDTTSYRFLSAL